jgi:nucleotide-binding universal stress UspA family protein
MYKKILVPLDGSKLAECVLTHVETITNGCGISEVVFVRVYEPLHAVAQDYILPEDSQQKGIEIAKNYLNDIKEKVKYDNAIVSSTVLVGRAPEGIADYANKNDFDLIVIATHGHSGISRWVWGGVADRILRSASIPVLMVRVPGSTPR